MPYSGYVIRFEHERQATVLAAVKAMPEVTSGQVAEQGLPLAATTPTSEEAMQLYERLEHIPGVMSVRLVYHNFEDSYET
ncbi:MAG: chaperone NapD [Verrucomicrobia bacterium]|nr:chaperone NapD [Verrucomicrobiota bacterium]